LTLGSIAVGSLKFTRGNSSATVTLNGTETNQALIGKLKLALEVLLGTGNVSVIGNRISGYEIELKGTLAGVSVTDIVAALTPAGISGAVQTTQEATPGVSEVKQISIEHLRGIPPAVEVSVTQLIGNTISSPVEVRYVQNDADNNKRYIQSGLLSLFGATSGIRVEFDGSVPGQHGYRIEFVGVFAKRNIGDLLVIESLPGEILSNTVQNGDSTRNEIKELIFTSPYLTKGLYKLALSSAQGEM
jgi:hypothetical protein